MISTSMDNTRPLGGTQDVAVVIEPVTNEPVVDVAVGDVPRGNVEGTEDWVGTEVPNGAK